MMIGCRKFVVMVEEAIAMKYQLKERTTTIYSLDHTKIDND